MIKSIFSVFFAPQGVFAPCGMFTAPHLVATAIAIIFSITAFLILRNRFNELRFRFLCRCFAIIVTALEITKIVHSFTNGYTNLDAWVPISYCSLFIYSLWMAGFGKGTLKDAGESFITYGCPIAGVAFLIFPTTSLMNYPIWHFLSLYSMFFHTMMLLLGLLCLYRTKRLTKRAYICYIGFQATFTLPAIILNVTKGSNLMNLREPYNIPIEAIQTLYQANEYYYTLAVFFTYMLIPFLVGLFFFKIKLNNQKNES